eukprot:NODE_26279_length_556_cov_11.440559.p3 GENE.NODE_26279_length_556_cov_11.440559~~NODE_26279_length_556_cov_11.440559.p3  ORF type:complete len:127 (-),score=37.85 NODE_26279_length_556_cov_11.440559:64-444(-)
MVQRLSYRRHCHYNTKSNQVKQVKTPGGRNVFHIVKKRSKGSVCGICHRVLTSIGHFGTHCKARNASRNKRTVSRPYGGTLCGKCVRFKIIRAFLIEEQKIVKKVMQASKEIGDDGKAKKPKKKTR